MASDSFDDLTRAFAAGASRRSVLRAAGMIFGAVVAATLGSTRANAQEVCRPEDESECKRYCTSKNCRTAQCVLFEGKPNCSCADCY